MSKKGKKDFTKYADIQINFQSLDKVLEKIALIRSQIEASKISGSSAVSGRSVLQRGVIINPEGRGTGQWKWSMYSVPTTNTLNTNANAYFEPGKMTNLDFVDEAADFYSMGYMNRATRSILSQIPGVSPMLYAVYRGRAAMVEFGRGSGLQLMSRRPVISGQIWRGGVEGKVYDSQIYGKFTGPDGLPTSGYELNIHPIIGAIVGIAMFMQFAKKMTDEIEQLNEDKKDRMRESMEEMTDREFARYMRANKKGLKGYAVW